MKRFLLVTLEYPPDLGGVAEYLQGLWQALPSGLAGEVVRAKISPWPFAWLFSLPRLWREIAAREPQAIVISHLLPMGYLAMLFSVFRRVPYVVIVHGTDLKRAMTHPRKYFWAKRILRRASLIVANSQYTRMFAASGFGLDQKRIQVVYPCPSGPMPPTPSARRGAPSLLSVARLVRRKGIDRMLKLLPALRDAFPGLRYVVIGSGPEEAKLKALARKLGVDSVVEFMGAQDRAAIERAYDQAGVFVLPGVEEGGDVEGFGLVFIEAARHGLPSVSGSAGGAPEAVIDHETGFVVDGNDPEALRRAIAALLGDPETARRYGEAARRRAEEVFTWKHQAAALAERLKAV